ncbi:HamA C-terminal domain-containing protein [Cellvibrio mixtus]|nr:DUF1837 domain-containing protein [Cellvibrio mixtus]
MTDLKNIITQNYSQIKETTLIELQVPDALKHTQKNNIKIENRFFYPALAANAKPNIDNFLKMLNGSIRRFSLSAKELEEHRRYTNEGDDIKAEEIAFRGRSRFVKYAKEAAKRAGEIGELALFIILEAYLEAPKISSKMRLKTSDQMHVHGSDALHASLGGNEILTIILGESKFHQQISQGRVKAIESIRACISDYLKIGKEIEIIEANIDHEILDKNLRDKILEYFGSFTPQSNLTIKVIAVLLGYDCNVIYKDLEKINNLDARKKELEKRYQEYAHTSAEEFAEALSKEDQSYFCQVQFLYILLPFSEIKILKEQFYKMAGLEKQE